MRLIHATVRSLVVASAVFIAGGSVASAQELAPRDFSREAVEVEPPSAIAKQFAISVDDLYYCYGFNEDTHTCNLYLGSRESCASLNPCFYPADEAAKTKRVQQIFDVVPDVDLYFCKGFNEDTNRCETYLGSRQSCNSLPECPE